MSRFADGAEEVACLGATIADLRAEKGLSLRDVGGAAGVSYQIVRRVEMGGNVCAGAVVALLTWLEATL